MARAKRGRLSTIDMLPEEAQPFICEALDALRKRKKPQTQILSVLNLKLGGIDCAPISKSAFGYEKEVLLPAGTAFRVRHVERNVKRSIVDRPRTYIHVEIVDQAEHLVPPTPLE